MYQTHFQNTIAAHVESAYHSGLLQYDNMMVCGITIQMVMRTKYNLLIATFNGKTQTVNLYNNDSDTCIESAITDLINAVLA